MTSNLTRNRHIFNSSPTTLSQLAAAELSLVCWRREMAFLNPEDKLHSHEFDYKEDLNGKLTIVAEQILDSFIKKTAYNLDKWISFHRKRIFLEFNRYDVILKCLRCVILNPLTANICYIKTAKKLLKYGILNMDEKYRIACVYCLRDEINILWPQVSDITRNGSPSNEFSVVSTNYWNNFKMNELIMIDLVEGKLDHRDPKNDPVWYDFIWPMYNSTDMYPLTKVQYFWSIFVSPEQILMPTILRSRQISPDVYIFLLHELSIDYQKDLLVKVGHIIIPVLAEEGAHISYTLQLWDLVKHSSRIRANSEFFVLIHHLWFMAYDGSTNCGFSVVALLTEIWISAPEHLRLGILGNYFLVEIFFDELKGYEDNKITDMRTYKRDVAFFNDLLFRTKTDFRITLWFRNWRKFVRLAALSDFIVLAKLCLNEHAFDKFRTFDMVNFADMRYHFLSFLRAGFLLELNEYFTYCLSNEDCIRIIKQRMLGMIDEMPYFTQRFDLDRSRKFDSFIDSAFPSTQLSQTYKKEFIRRNLTLWLKQPFAKGHHFNETRNLIESLIPNDPDLDQIKCKFFELCEITLTSASFDRFHGMDWDAFVKWCAPDRWTDFKKNLPAETIFLSLLTDVIRGRKLIQSLGPEEFYDKLRTGVISYPSYWTLNQFLWWYYREQDVRYAIRFKKKMASDYYGKEIKTILMEESSIIIIEMLKWFFDDVNAEVADYLQFLSTQDWFVDKYQEISALI